MNLALIYLKPWLVIACVALTDDCYVVSQHEKVLECIHAGWDAFYERQRNEDVYCTHRDTIVPSPRNPNRIRRMLP